MYNQLNILGYGEIFKPLFMITHLIPFKNLLMDKKANERLLYSAIRSRF